MNMHSYLEIVAEQIRCKRARSAVLEELQGHIEDQKQAYMADGMTGPEAEEEAVRQMGDPVETGTELDRVHRPKMDWLLLGVILLLSAAGLFLQWLTYQQPDSAYKIWQVWRQGKFMAVGILVMAGICLADYTLLGRHAFRIWKITLYIALIYRFYMFIENGFSMWLWAAPWFPGSFILLSYAAVVWDNTKKGRKGVIQSLICLGISAAVWLFLSSSVFVTGVLTVIGAAVFCAAAAKGWFGERLRPVALRICTIAAAGFMLMMAVSLGSAAISQRSQYRAERIEAWMNVAESPFYVETKNDVKELAAADRAGRDLTGTELEWARFDIRSTYLWMYIFRYMGTVPIVLLTLLAGVFLALIMRTIMRQNNRLGFLLGLSAVLFFALQVVWYVAMNVGLLPVTAVYMPFCTQGGANLCVTYVYAGILLSVYRNSSVVRC